MKQSLSNLFTHTNSLFLISTQNFSILACFLGKLCLFYRTCWNGVRAATGKLELAVQSYQSLLSLDSTNDCCDGCLEFSDCLWVVSVDVVFLKVECTKVKIACTPLGDIRQKSTPTKHCKWKKNKAIFIIFIYTNNLSVYDCHTKFQHSSLSSR